jgi:hypothetical protein
MWNQSMNDIVKSYKFNGLLSLHHYGDAQNTLFLSSLLNPLALELENIIFRRIVSIRYWITDKQVSKETAQEQFLKTLYGEADPEFSSKYSEITGYLWTDEFCKIGGHDLIEILKSHVGSWLYMEIDLHKNKFFSKK